MPHEKERGSGTDRNANIWRRLKGYSVRGSGVKKPVIKRGYFLNLPRSPFLNRRKQLLRSIVYGKVLVMVLETV
jgi:hypothetical protein